MNDVSDTTTSHDQGTDPRKTHSGRKWIFFALFFLVAVSMYAGTWYRITTDGFMGTGKNPQADSKTKNQDASPPQVATPK